LVEIASQDMHSSPMRHDSDVVSVFRPKNLWLTFAVMVFVLLVAARMPHILIAGRFWGEEGPIYFYNAWTLPWWQALLRPDMGYLNFPGNGAALIARYAVPLEDAPYVTTIIALFLQTIPALFIVTSPDRWLRSPVVLLAAVILLATPPEGDEVWINTATSQFHLAVAAGLCLALDIPARKAAFIRLAFLLMVPLCGPATVALVPLFLARAWLERDRSRGLQGVALLIGAVIQFAVFYYPMKGRGHMLGPSVLASVIAARHIALPLLGQDLARVVAADLRDSIRAAQPPVVAFLVVTATSGLLAAGIACARRAVSLWLLAAAIAIAAISYFGALAGGIDLITVDSDQRYVFAPASLLDLTVLSLAATGKARVSAIAWLFCSWLIVTGLIQATCPHPSIFASGPDWKNEVRRWRRDHSVALSIWPSPWNMRLPMPNAPPSATGSFR